MICIHPTITHNRETLAELQLATGLRVALGQSYLRLVNADGTAPTSKPVERKRTFTHPSDFTPGGNAA
jgi:hypothetical protein